jgi:hypothetical protein
MKTIIAGSRTALYEHVYYAIKSCPFKSKITEIVSGTARGADKFGEEIAEKFNISVKRFPADWDRYGKRAGYVRNEEMAKYADALIAVWDGKSKGTKNMIDIAKKENLLVHIFYIG